MLTDPNQARKLVEELVEAAMAFERAQHEPDGDTQYADMVLTVAMENVLVHLGVKPIMHRFRNSYWLQICAAVVYIWGGAFEEELELFNGPEEVPSDESVAEVGHTEAPDESPTR